MMKEHMDLANNKERKKKGKKKKKRLLGGVALCTVEGIHDL